MFPFIVTLRKKQTAHSWQVTALSYSLLAIRYLLQHVHASGVHSIEEVMKGHEQDIERYRIKEEPFYAEVRGEVGLFTIAAKNRMPVMLKGPTGCGKTRFVQYMAYRLGRPLITVACHEDLTASDLVGRYLLKGQETVWIDGPLTLGVKHGAIVYLDEIVEARKDTTVIIHPLSDDRRLLPIEKKGQLIEAVDDFMLVISYNPGYQSVLKDLKQSTKQRFMAIEFGYPTPGVELRVVEREAGVDKEVALKLVKLGEKVRNLKNHGLEEGVSTRLLIYAGTLIKQGVPPDRACEVAVSRPITDDPDMHRSIQELVKAIF
jgi:nitric oxide reductase NorQ protein